MEAEDTVMNDEVLGELFDALDYEGYTYHFSGLMGWVKNFIRETAKAQAEVSFKAGKREVAEWIYDYLFYKGSEHIHGLPIDVWEAKLKEWGIE